MLLEICGRPRRHLPYPTIQNNENRLWFNDEWKYVIDQWVRNEIEKTRPKSIKGFEMHATARCGVTVVAGDKYLRDVPSRLFWCSSSWWPWTLHWCHRSLRSRRHRWCRDRRGIVRASFFNWFGRLASAFLCSCYVLMFDNDVVDCWCWLDRARAVRFFAVGLWHEMYIIGAQIETAPDERDRYVKNLPFAFLPKT